MSVQVKKQFEEMAKYLTRDAIGLEKLRKLKEAVNVLRTSLAAANEQQAREHAAKELAVNRALSAESDLAEARTELHSLRQQVVNLARDLKTKTTTEQMNADSNDSISDDSGEQAVVTKVMKTIRKRMKHCPAPICVSHVAKNSSRDNRWAAYDRESLAEGWSHESLWFLGASVAVLSGFFGEVRIETKNRVQKHIKEDRLHEGFGSNLIRWIAKHHSEEIGFPKADPEKPKYYETELEQENINALMSRGYH